MINLAQGFKIVEGLNHQIELDGNPAFADVDLRFAHTCFVVVHSLQAAAAAYNLNFERDDGTGAWIAMANNSRIWLNADVTVNDTLVRQDDANITFELTNTATRKLVIVQVDPAALGLHTATGDPCTRFRIQVANGNVNDYASGVYYLAPYRYQQATPPTAL